MKGSEERFLRFLEGSKKRFVIPVYQRNYDWRTEHCRQLYDDLLKVVREKRKSHFFGSLVSVYNPDGQEDEFLIIDGQQRLTTVSLLLLAMYSLIRDGVLVPTSGHLGSQIYEDYLVDKWQPQETRIKLKPIKNDQAAFGRLFTPDEDPVAGSNLTINYAYFAERLQRKEVGADELFDAISRLEIINITLNRDDNPQLIFESLNSTGLDLSEGDKIRNFVLMGLPSRKQEAYYDKYWNKIEVCTAYDVSAFVRDYLSVKRQSTPTEKSVYSTFKEYRGAFADTETLLQDLLCYAKRYEILIKGMSPWPQVNECLYRLGRLKTTVTRPFLMEVLRLRESGDITEQEVYAVISAVESYLFRRTICDLPTNTLNKIFLMLHHEILRLDGSTDNYWEKFVFVLRSKRESGRFPDDEEFLEALSNKNIYAMKGESKLYLFERLENAGTSETKDVWSHLDKGEYTIEHIMPQTLTQMWIGDLGDDYEQIHTSWLNRLANLTLTGYNARYSNRPFADKRDMENGYKESGLRMNQWICRQDSWGEAELIERNAQLAARAMQIWPLPESAYQPPEKLLDVVVLDDADALTGKTISKFSFRGLEYPAESWVDMYQQVLTLLHTEDKSVLTRLAVTDDPNVDLSIHFATRSDSFTASRMIDTHVYVYTATDTQYKVNILKKVFALFNVDLSELVFYLRGDTTTGTNAAGRHAVRLRYWSYALPIIRERTGIFANVNPGKDNWLNGYFGVAGVCVSCVANYDGARVELSINRPQKAENKALFNALSEQKKAIEAQAGVSFTWYRVEDVKSCKVYLSLSNVDITNEADWPRMAEFHAWGGKVILDAFRGVLEESR